MMSLSAMKLPPNKYMVAQPMAAGTSNRCALCRPTCKRYAAKFEMAIAVTNPVSPFR